MCETLVIDARLVDLAFLEIVKIINTFKTGNSMLKM